MEITNGQLSTILCVLIEASERGDLKLIRQMQEQLREYDTDIQEVLDVFRERVKRSVQESYFNKNP